jgi:Ca2+-binding RTX toxin-like protein
LKIGKLSKSQFTLGSVSEDRGDRFIYDSFTGKLLFDADGTGRIRAVTLARLSKGLSLAHNDINIVA